MESLCRDHIGYICFLLTAADNYTGSQSVSACTAAPCGHCSFPSQLLPLCSDFQSKLDPASARRERKPQHQIGKVLHLLLHAATSSARLTSPTFNSNVSVMPGGEMQCRKTLFKPKKPLNQRKTNDTFSITVCLEAVLLSQTVKQFFTQPSEEVGSCASFQRTESAFFKFKPKIQLTLISFIVSSLFVNVCDLTQTRTCKHM